MNAFIINDTINSRADLNLRITRPPELPSAKRIINRIDVDGREGSLTILKGWEDTIFEISVALLGSNIRSRYHDILPTLFSAETICFSNAQSGYYKVKTVEVSPLVMNMRSLGEFTLTFTCAPFRYLSGIDTIVMTQGGRITNTGTIYSLPKITVYGTGTSYFSVVDSANVVTLIRLNILSDSLTLDSELKECFYGNVAQNNCMTGDFPSFAVGINTLIFGNPITKLEIDPRWRQI